ILLSISPLYALAQDGHSHTSAPQQQELTPEQKSKASALIKIVRESTERFKSVRLIRKYWDCLTFVTIDGKGIALIGLISLC
ncbi:MAG TPA: hypothetical protein VK641_08955, partial [Terriglobales bacterium]|nr:hypothetical protein [Terriglobales bacterium]